MLAISGKCMQSPRTVARAEARQNSRVLPMSPRRYPALLESCRDEGAHLSVQAVPSFPAQPRSHPVSHPPSEPPLCPECRKFNLNFSEKDDLEFLRVESPQPEAEEIIRQMLAGGGGRLRGAWWCEKCMALLAVPTVKIADLFAILRQWSPYTQLQLDTIVIEMMRRGAHVDDRDALTDMTLLHFTAKSGALGNEEMACSIAGFLLDSGACVEARCGWTDMTALHYAAYFDCPRLAELLVLRGADPLVRSAVADAATPLHMAAAQLSLGTARLLAHLPIALRPVGPRQPSGHISTPITCKEALDACMRIPYDLLPPSGELPEPLSGMRDRLAELLGPPLDEKAKKRLALLGAGCVQSQFRAQTVTSEESTYFRAPADSRARLLGPSPTHLGSPAPSRRVNTPGWQILTPDPSAPEPEVPMPAETGILSPRVRRALAPTESTRWEEVRTPCRQAHPPRTGISAKVTLQSLGLHLGDRVCVGPGQTGHPTGTEGGVAGRMGRLRYCGPVGFASGVWVGLELDEPCGRNDGSVNSLRYFECSDKHGIFAPIGRVYKYTRSRFQTPPLADKPPASASLRRKVSLSDKPLEGGKSRASPADFSHVSAKVDTGRHQRVHLTLDDVEVGDEVIVSGRRSGVVRFIGPTDFAPGIWYGIEMHKSVGRNDGSLNGRRYFTCPPKHGVFAPLIRLQKLTSPQRLAASMTQSLHTDTAAGVTSRSSSGASNRSPLSDLPAGYASLGRPRSTKCQLSAETRFFQAPLSASNQNQAQICLKVGMQVLCNNQLGILRFMGGVHFTEGVWLGIELRHSVGRHDGTVAGHRYFTCPPSHGVLVRPSKVSYRGISAATLLPPDLQHLEAAGLEARV